MLQSCVEINVCMYLPKWSKEVCVIDGGGCELCRQPSVDMKYHLNIKCELQYNCNRS
jgi:hypothetical protein